MHNFRSHKVTMGHDGMLYSLPSREIITGSIEYMANGLPWDGIISADFFGKVKPDISIYGNAAEMLCMDPAEVMMVACHTQDLDAARTAGFRTAYVNRPLEYGPDRPPEAKPDPYDYDADNFIELAQMLRADKAAGNV